MKSPDQVILGAGKLEGPVKTFRQLKDFWLKERPVDPATGEEVLSYQIRTEPDPARPGYCFCCLNARLIDRKRHTVYTKFFLYIEDAFYNANLISLRREQSRTSNQTPEFEEPDRNYSVSWKQLSCREDV